MGRASGGAVGHTYPTYSGGAATGIGREEEFHFQRRKRLHGE
jgi:hypothetical protein